MADIKTGWRTSEFVLALVAVVVGVAGAVSATWLAVAGLLNSWVAVGMSGVGGAVVVGSVVTYTGARVRVKRDAVTQLPPGQRVV